MLQPNNVPPSERDACATLAALEQNLTTRRQCEVDDLQLVLHWADLHSAGEPDFHRPRQRGQARLIECAGDGAPGVSDLAMSELAVARSCHTHAARSITADALDLRHRLPHVWSVLKDLRAEVWVGRKIAKMTRHLDQDRVSLLDHAVAEALIGHSPARVFEVCEAKIIEADQAAHAARIEEQLKKRFVGLTRPNCYGMQSLIARNPTGDTDDLMTIINDVADALAPRIEYEHCTRDELRAEALTWLARPEDVLHLLNPTQPEEEPDNSGGQSPGRKRKPAIIYVHLHQAALEGGDHGIARVEELGPHTLAQLRRLLGHRDVTITPVIDLTDAIATNAYEHPDTIRNRIHLLRPGSGFPHATTTSRNVDLDHPIAWTKHGPPGQTNSHTSQPLTRTEHRAKTHLNYRATPRAPGETLWRTPHGLTRIVDHRGTRKLGPYDSPLEFELAELLARIPYAG